MFPAGIQGKNSQGTLFKELSDDSISAIIFKT